MLWCEWGGLTSTHASISSRVGTGVPLGEGGLEDEGPLMVRQGLDVPQYTEPPGHTGEVGH